MTGRGVDPRENEKRRPDPEENRRRPTPLPAHAVSRARSNGFAEDLGQVVGARGEVQRQRPLLEDRPLEREVGARRHPVVQVHDHDPVVAVPGEQARGRLLHEVGQQLVRDRDEGQRLHPVEHEGEKPVLQAQLREAGARRQGHSEAAHHESRRELSRARRGSGGPEGPGFGPRAGARGRSESARRRIRRGRSSGPESPALPPAASGPAPPRCPSCGFYFTPVARASRGVCAPAARAPATGSPGMPELDRSA